MAPTEKKVPAEAALQRRASSGGGHARRIEWIQGVLRATKAQCAPSTWLTAPPTRPRFLLVLHLLKHLQAARPVCGPLRGPGARAQRDRRRGENRVSHLAEGCPSRPRGRIRICRRRARQRGSLSAHVPHGPSSFRPRPERVACQRAGFERPVADGPFTAVRVVGTERGRARGRSRQARRRVRGRERVHRMPQVRAHRTDDILDRNPVWMRQGGGSVGGWEGSSRRRGGSLPGAVHPFCEQTCRASTARARRREAVEGWGERRRRQSRQGYGELNGVAIRHRRVAREESREGRSHRLALPPGSQGVERGR